jgi:pyrroline-5-carboxylate reductase
LNITFIGGGNMATALIAGLLKAGPGPLTVRVADPSKEARERLVREHGVETFPQTAAAVRGADVIVLAAKPQAMPTVLAELAPVIEEGQLALSIAAGTTVSDMQSALGKHRPVVRAMPNTPALIGRGICGLFASETCRRHHLEQAERIMRAVGEAVWVQDEALMDVVTAISGSGPAYFFLLTEALTIAGTDLGLREEDARRFAICTAEGAGAMLRQSEESPEVLRTRVTSPGGTTQAAIDLMESRGFRDLVGEAVRAATRRGRELAG